MNEILAPSRRRVRTFFKNVAWKAASHVGLYGLTAWDLEDDWLNFQRRQMVLPSLGAELEGATIVHLSDLHCCPVMRQRHLMKYIEITNRLEPDFVVITGDFITASARHYARRARELLGELAPRRATLAVLGNHDHGIWVPRTHEGVPGLSAYVADQLHAAGVDVLCNRSRTFFQGSSSLSFVGVDDLWSPQYDPAGAFATLPGGSPVVALVHNPDASGDLARLGARYILAGHTHGKPVPDTMINKLLFPVEHRHLVGGEYAIGQAGRVYVNGGLGPTRRVQADHRPEITQFTLTSRRTREGAGQGGSVGPIVQDWPTGIQNARIEL
jgi:hypothetical protein